jgi:drug/metabolite transporter (DMT)-like permease
LSFTTPLFAVVLAALIFKEAVGPWRWAAVMLGFFGVIVIAQPGSTSTDSISLFGAALGLLNALMVAIVSLQIRDLGRSESTLTMTFYFAAIGTPIAAVFLPFYASAHEAWLWATMLSVGVLGTICQMCMAASLRFGPVSTVIPMDYSSIVWATLLGWLIWNHLPGASMLLGAPLIIASGLLIVWREHRHHRQPPPATSAIVD